MTAAVIATRGRFENPADKGGKNYGGYERMGRLNSNVPEDVEEIKDSRILELWNYERST